jgi:uncharacterized protein (DUF983 family)
MHGSPKSARVARILIVLMVGVAVVLGWPWLTTVQDERWWQVLPWVLLAAFWAYLIVLHRRGVMIRAPWSSSDRSREP